LDKPRFVPYARTSGAIFMRFGRVPAAQYGIFIRLQPSVRPERSRFGTLYRLVICPHSGAARSCVDPVGLYPPLQSQQDRQQSPYPRSQRCRLRKGWEE